MTANTHTAVSKLDQAELLAAAERAADLNDWGSQQDFRVGLTRLIGAINEMNASAEFVHHAHERLLNSLVMHLHLVDDAKRHPEILQEKIERPIVIIGLPRTGTTVLYDLLALDPATRTPRNWEFASPWPAPDAATWDSDPRIATMNAMFAAWLERAPKLADIQVFDAAHPSECNLAFTHHFASTQFPGEWGLPSYAKWLRETQVPGRYAAHKRILQQLQWRGPRGRWTLKSPEHLFTVEGLVEAYPDASLVWTHRDPVSAFSSLASMQSEFHMAFGVPPDRIASGRYVMDTWGAALEHATKVRADNPSVERRIIDIAHKDTIRDKPGVVRRIHEHFKLPFTAEHEARVQAAASGRVSERLGRHKHNPADFGITVEEVRARLPRYLARFGSLF